MYLTFYGLAAKPFNPTPDPKFLYMSLGHREALAQLQYGVEERKGFIVLTGKVGTGKTTLLHALRQRLSGQTAVAFVFNSTLPFDDLLEYALHRSEEHTSELQSLAYLVCRLLLEKKNAQAGPNWRCP